MYYSITILVLIVLMFLSGFFASSEVALFSLSKVRLRRRKVKTAKPFKYIVKLLKTPSTFLATVLIGNEIVNICISVVAAALFYSLTRDIISDRYLPFCSMAVTVPVLLLICDIIPKTIAIKYPERIALFNAYPLYLFSIAIIPVRHILNSFAKLFIGLFVKDPTKQPIDSVVIDEEIFRSMVDIGSREGAIEPAERDLIHERIVAVSQDIGENALMDLIYEKKFSRYPVYEKSLDRIVGFVHAKELLRLKGSAKKKKPFAIKAILRRPTFVSEGRNALSVLLQFQKRNTHIGIIVDDQGKTVGIVTLEDILEELFGDIMDETDREGKDDV